MPENKNEVIASAQYRAPTTTSALPPVELSGFLNLSQGLTAQCLPVTYRSHMISVGNLLKNIFLTKQASGHILIPLENIFQQIMHLSRSTACQNLRPKR